MNVLITKNGYKLILENDKYKVYSPKTKLITYLSKKHERAFKMFETLSK